MLYFGCAGYFPRLKFTFTHIEMEVMSNDDCTISCLCKKTKAATYPYGSCVFFFLEQHVHNLMGEWVDSEIPKRKFPRSLFVLCVDANTEKWRIRNNVEIMELYQKPNGSRWYKKEKALLGWPRVAKEKLPHTYKVLCGSL